MDPARAQDILYYYAGAIGFALIALFAFGRKHKGMRLRFRKSQRPAQTAGCTPDNVINITGQPSPSIEKFSHIQARGERPLNVVFNYNGHSWDAYEVLGLPAGSAMENVEKAYRDSLATVDAGSRSFMEAAYHAIQSEWKSYKVAGHR